MRWMSAKHADRNRLGMPQSVVASATKAGASSTRGHLHRHSQRPGDPLPRQRHPDPWTPQPASPNAVADSP